MADRRQAMDDAAVSLLVEPGQDRRRLIPGGGVLVPHVAEPVQLLEEQAGPGRVEAVRRIRLQPAKHVQVVEERPRPVVEAGDQRAVEDDRLQALVGTGEPAEGAVAGHLDTQVELLAAAAAVEQERVRARPVGTRVQPLDAAAVDPQRRLAVRDPEQVDPRARPGFGDGGADPKPPRAPERAELLPHARGAEFQRCRLVQSDPAGRPGDLQQVRRLQRGIDECLQARRHVTDPVTGVGRVALHPRAHTTGPAGYAVGQRDPRA
jgi:hypothetical protein